MKILLFAPNYLPATRYGGPVRSSHGLAKGLVALGHDVHVVTTNVDGPGVIDAPLGKTVDVEGVKVRYYPIEVPRRLYYAPQMGHDVDKEIATYDAVHTNGMFLWPGPRIARAAVRARVPLVISPRGMLVSDLIAGRSTLIKTAWIRLQERWCLARADAIHVTSEAEADGVRQLGLDLAPVHVIGNGVDLPDALPADADIARVWEGVPAGARVAFLARLDWTKGLDLAIEAVRAHPNAVLLIAGHDQIGLRRELEARLTRDDGSKAGRFVGPLDGVDKWALLAGADVLLAPSVRESFGMSVAEALCVGTPVICTPGVGAAEIVWRIDPSLVVERDAAALHERLCSLLGDMELRADLSAHARDLMGAEYGWHPIASKISALYTRHQEALRHNGPSHEAKA